LRWFGGRHKAQGLYNQLEQFDSQSAHARREGRHVYLWWHYQFHYHRHFRWRRHNGRSSGRTIEPAYECHWCCHCWWVYHHQLGARFDRGWQRHNRWLEFRGRAPPDAEQRDSLLGSRIPQYPGAVASWGNSCPVYDWRHDQHHVPRGEPDLLQDLRRIQRPQSERWADNNRNHQYGSELVGDATRQ